MKFSGKLGKGGAGVLGLVSAAPVVNLGFPLGGFRTGGFPAAKKTAERSGGQTADNLMKYDPVVHLDFLKQLEDRPLPELERNPFQFPVLGPEGRPMTPEDVAAEKRALANQPPPPPAVPLKPFGYAEKLNGLREAMASYQDDIYIVHVGETVAGKYKIIGITPSRVIVNNVATHETVELPIPE